MNVFEIASQVFPDQEDYAQENEGVTCASGNLDKAEDQPDPYSALWKEKVDTLSVFWSRCPLNWIKEKRPNEWKKAQVLEREIENHWHKDFDLFKKACHKFEMYMWTLYAKYSDVAEIKDDEYLDCFYLKIQKEAFGCAQCDGLHRGAWCKRSDRNNYVSIEILKECPLKTT